MEVRQDIFIDGTKTLVNPDENENMVRLVFIPLGLILVYSTNGPSSTGAPSMYQSVDMFMLSVVSVRRQ